MVTESSTGWNAAGLVAVVAAGDQTARPGPRVHQGGYSWNPGGAAETRVPWAGLHKCSIS